MGGGAKQCSYVWKFLAQGYSEESAQCGYAPGFAFVGVMNPPTPT